MQVSQPFIHPLADVQSKAVGVEWRRFDQQPVTHHSLLGVQR